MESEENWDEELEQNNQSTDQPPPVEVVEVIPGYSNFDQYLQTAFDALRGGIKAANSLPSGENFNYYACFPSFNNARNKDIQTLLASMQNIISTAGVSGQMHKLEAEEKFDLLVEANDIFLDRAGACMDEECGITRNPGVELIVSQSRKQHISGSWNVNTSSKESHTTTTPQPVRLLAGKNIQRPQITFKDKIDNSSKPWEPRIKEKPNALKPLFIHLDEDEVTYCHPYEFELNRFEPPEIQLQSKPPKKYKSLEETSLIIVEKPEDINILLEDLKNYTEIAVDLEHHSYRSFQGITCLMQISTGDTDYLIDTLTLRSELYQLNEIFTKPTILKVFHGADCDIQWLQRDLSIYVVNMFDTHQAAKQLNLPYLSLAYLLKEYCGMDPNKHFQLADWRIRPLPEELILYAREDTHYLLYIKDILRNALINMANGKSNILKSVYDKSTEICKQVYIKPIWTEDSYMNIYRKSHKIFNNKQLYALKELHKWRDQTARQEDDSVGYVLPNHMLLNIAETLPREMQGILACCNPIPPMVRQNLLKLHKMILKAREQPLIKPILEDPRQRVTQSNHDVNSEVWMYSPHDIPGGTEARADLPCLLDDNNSQKTERPLINDEIEHIVTIFDSPSPSEDEDSNHKSTSKSSPSKKNKLIFVSPFERYKRVRPMIAEEEAKEREKQQKEDQEQLEKLKEDEEETQLSKSRVLEHFKTVSQQVKTKPQQPRLSEMPGKKRKLDSNIINEKVKSRGETDADDEDLTTPVPRLDASQMKSNQKREAKNQNPELRPKRVKGEKKLYRKELQKQGLLPADKFNYKSVDFSSFQGGSLNSMNQVKFEQKQPKNKKRGKKRKKQNLGI